MAEAVYFLCALASLLVTYLLFLSYRRSRLPLLCWSGLCFAGLALNNLFMLADLVFTPELDFTLPRNLCGVVGVSLLLFGMLWSQPRSAGKG